MSHLAVHILLACSLAAQAPEPRQSTEPTLTHGPLPGHVDVNSAHVFARVSVEGEYVMRLSAGDEPAREATARADAAHDLALHFVFEGLSWGTKYDIALRHGDRDVAVGVASLRTAMPPAARTSRVVFGSCANDVRFPEQPIWARIAAREPHALVLLGDTPYIDDGTVAGRRRRHREFLGFAPLQPVLRTVPTWTTWDDHDYATNDTFGEVPGSETAREVFVDYHAHASYGDGTRGIYTRFRRGAMEEFGVDTRSFADTGTSPLAPGERTLLGAAQLAWLQQGLRESTATFKVLACGMVWNGGVREGKKDCWGNWLGERDALWAWLGAAGVRGVVLVSGDVHRSRVILHPTRKLLGYDLPEFVTSPLAQSVIEANKVDVPGLVFDAGEPSSCLCLEAHLDAADGGTLTARFEAGDGRVFHEHAMTLAGLGRPDAAALYRQAAAELRTLFGEHLQNSLVSALGREQMLADSVAACTAELRAEVANAGSALALLERASFEPRCTFWSTCSEPMVNELGNELLWPLVCLLDLEMAKGLQCLADGDIAELGRVVRLVLATVRHLQQTPCAMAWALGNALEQAAAELVLRVPLQDAARPAVLAEVRKHLERRAAAAALVDALAAELEQLVDQSLLALGEQESGNALVRRHEAEVRRGLKELSAPTFAAARAVASAASDARWEALRAAEHQFRIAYDAARKQQRRLEHAETPQVLVGLLGAMLAPSVSGALERHEESEQLLREVLR